MNAAAVLSRTQEATFSRATPGTPLFRFRVQRRCNSISFPNQLARIFSSTIPLGTVSSVLFSLSFGWRGNAALMNLLPIPQLRGGGARSCPNTSSSLKGKRRTDGFLDHFRMTFSSPLVLFFFQERKTRRGFGLVS